MERECPRKFRRDERSLQRVEMLNLSLFAFAIGGEIVNLLWQSGPVAKAVLIILLAFSILSWSIILSKWGFFRRARVQSGRFNSFKFTRVHDFSLRSWWNPYRRPRTGVVCRVIGGRHG